ncbi:SDR family NAD(P)-dependent oxidoreductase [Hyphomonas sp.]|uniref:SDR family NAD(P)-dependent oxidoreductase n=1 Tax=Hyphomonas sp. TaxID=87 RepID=UPI001D7DCADA|nr:SDR family NAD(P)-dependent oxidoreductase [Hyphomonas sp.]MBU3922073.1 SDR family NAD(P)-dependent oxidoreductase [Alphaproteobacteria bacterium]MBU4061603.1 SDR family NAD(P)-dependent oxidoreductase [Alphaproteobacteria bacterium]MBU4163448.1 SDR family NAD(P)-dependent oxidoreductase [Alphaproteobacteria bacterium]
MKNQLKRYGSWALVTGASSGIGREFVRQLAAEGMSVILVARRHDLLADLAREICREFNVEARPVERDLLADGAAEQLHADFSGYDVGLVVMCAGVENTGHFTKLPLQRHADLLRLNADVPMRMARLFGETMIRRRRGALIFVSSLLGYQGVPVLANYAASKAYILALGEALHIEMKPLGVDVLALSPGLTDTAMPARMPVDMRKMPMPKLSPVRVVRVALAALGRKASVVPGFVNTFFAFENRLVPRIWPVQLFGRLMVNAITPDNRNEILHTKP